MLAVVDAVVMLVVASSLARVLRIGVASMIRYRAKLDDPKDAVAMLATAGLNRNLLQWYS